MSGMCELWSTWLAGARALVALLVAALEPLVAVVVSCDGRLSCLFTRAVVGRLCMCVCVREREGQREGWGKR